MVKKLVKEVIGEVSLKTLLVSLLFIASIFIFAFLAYLILQPGENAFDVMAFNFFNQFRSEQFIAITRVITFFGASYFSIPAYLILLLVLYLRRQRSDAINIAIVAITSSALMFGLKEFFKRQRPELPLLKELTNFSFPSGHALTSFIFCSVLIYLVWKSDMALRWKWVVGILLFLLSMSIGISRIVLRYHYATDVAAGFCLGFVWVVLSLWLERKLTPRRVERQLDA